MSLFLPWVAASAAVIWMAPRAWQRLQLSRAKHPSLAGHARWSRRIAGWLPHYELDEARWFCADEAPADVAERRRQGFERLAALFAARHPRGRALTAEAMPLVSDLQFTAHYRVPFQFSRRVREQLGGSAFVERSEGGWLIDVDGQAALDVSGAYGVNVFGYDFYKRCMQQAHAVSCALGPVLGPYHPLLLDNARRLLAIAGMDEVSFHMSGTEAVMQAVRLARYHTRRTHLVRFCGAYHGWWGDVQPGVGNPLPADYTYTLRDMHERSLQVLRTRRDIACVLVNPLQALHPNGSAPGDSALVDGARQAHFDREAYAAWLRELRAVCDQRGIVLIFDEVFLGFRLGKGGAQAYFGVRADLVTYGKTLGGGYPVGAVCGKAALMKRFRPDRPADICFARGTFNSHPTVMAAMNAFLVALDEDPAIAGIYRDLDRCWPARLAELNRQLDEVALPVRVAGLSSVWTVLFSEPGRYHWMFQFYLRAEGLALSWVGSGRMTFSLDCSDADFAEVCRRFVAAATRMREDGWWWSAGLQHRQIRRQVLREMIGRG